MGAVYMECSSKEMNGVEDIFDKAITMAVGDEHIAPDEKMYTRPGGASAMPGGPAVSSFGGAAKKKKSKSCTIL